MTRSRTLLALLVVALSATMVAPAGAARSRDPNAARDAVRSTKEKLASELNTLNASESQLLSAERTLKQQVSAQTGEVAGARQAQAAAEAELSDANRALDTTKSSITKLSRALVDRAVATYMSPRSADPAALGDTSDLALTARRQVLLESVSASNTDLVDQLRSAQQDYAAQLKAARAARDRAGSRRANSEARLAALRKAQADDARIAAGVLARKQDVLGEIDAQSQAEAELTRIIRERSQQAGGAASAARNAGGCIWPAQGSVTSEYGNRWGRLHAGIDIAAPVGTPIWAAKSGTVIFAGEQSGYGTTVIIDHGGGMSTLYAHQSRLGSSQGDQVSQGQVIGYIGNTGHSTGPHVHFETRYDGNPRNPRGCLP